MAETPNVTPPVASKTPEPAIDPKPAAEAAARPVKEVAKAAEAAAQASSEILRSQAETAQSAVSTGLQASVRGFEGLAQGWTRMFGLTTPSTELAETSSRNLQAVSQASTALARGAQDASKAWMELTQKTARTNIEALGHLAQARSFHELIAAQTSYVRDSLEQAIAGGEQIARVSSDAIREATRAIHPQG
jgi:phasin family protein